MNEKPNNNAPKNNATLPVKGNVVDDFSNSLIDNLHGTFSIISQEGVVLKWNKNLEIVSGYSAEEIAVISPLDFFDDDTKALIAQKIQSTFENGKDEVEAQLITKAGQKIDYLYTAKTILYKGQPCITVIGIDVSAKKTAHDKLIASEKKYRTLFEQSNDAIIIGDFEGRFIDVNTATCTMFGYTVDELLQMTVFDLMEPTQAAAEPIRFDLLREGEQIMKSRKMVHKSDAIIEIENNVKRISDNRILAIIKDVTAKKKAENKLIAREQRYNDALQGIEAGVWDYYDFQNQLLHLSPRYLQLLGREYEDRPYKQQEIEKWIDADDYKKSETAFSDYIQNKIPNYKIDLRYIMPDGSKRWFSNSGKAAYDSEGNLVRIVGSIIDIHEQKIAEEAIRASEETRRLIMESSLDAVVCIDLKGEIILWTPQAEKTFGWTEQEAVGKTLSETIIPQQYREQHAKGFKHYLTTNTGPVLGKLIEITALNKAGHEFPVEMSIVSIGNGSNRFACGFLRDISQRKAAEQALMASEANLQTIFSTTDVAYTLLDTNFKALSFNSEAARFALIELNHIGAVGDYLPDYFSDERKPFILSALQEVLIGKCINYESNYPQPDGTINWYNVKLYPITNAQNIVLGIILAITDITHSKTIQLHREKLASDMLQRNKDLEQFAYIISHNLRAPVANIMGFAEIFNDDSYSEEEKAEFASHLSSSANKLDEVIKDLNHILQVKQEVSEHKETVSFSRILRDIESSITNMITNEQVVITADFSSVDSIETIKSYLYSIFYNLITNSIKYRRPGIPPLIEISSRKNDNSILLVFEDNGLGIDLTKKGEQVFGLYKRFHTNAAEGKGMGLYMTKTQVEAIGGKIHISSYVNEGTIFTIELPL